MTTPIQHLVTSGTFSLDGGTWEVDNNVWIVGDRSEVLIIDAAHDAEAIASAVGDRRVVAVVCTHAHDDHVNQAPALADRFDAPILLNPAEAALWQLTWPDRKPDGELSDGQMLSAGGVELRALVTPGHSPGSTCLYAPELATVFSGDTLFNGGPGRTLHQQGYEAILRSLEQQLFGLLPDDTQVCTGHGDSTSLGRERPHLGEWRDAGFRGECGGGGQHDIERGVCVKCNGRFS